MNEEMQQVAQLDAARKTLLTKILDRAAVERLGRVRLANPMLANQLEAYLVQLYQAGQLKETIDDSKLKQILDVLTAQPRKTTIKRR